MRKSIIFIYGIVSYLIALVAQIWFILYLGEWEFMPVTVNGHQTVSLISALSINFALVLLFGLQHSIMARPSFKRYLTQIIPQASERSTYVLFSGLALGLICLYWQPLNGYLWQVENETGKALLTAGYLFGWLFSLFSTFIINHFELFGLQQIYLNFINKPEPAVTFQEKLFYRLVRHPIQLGVLIGIWLTPSMSYSHMMLSVTLSIYIFIGLWLEEKDLLAAWGTTYQEYQRRVRMILPFPK
ncbi:methyltransferase family protein [Sulfuricurvum sp.]|uniref:methyltransferase family protein n=1 Tax=Sulfuricurvum sp. TaxID=2025608 RepID=UPI003BAF929E